MEALKTQVARARRRMLISTSLVSFGWCLFGCLTVAAALIVASWYWVWNLNSWVLLGSAAGVAVVLAAIHTVRHATQPLLAAIEVDRRFGLRERVSSALSLQAEDLESEAGQALAADAERRVRGLDIPQQFPVAVGRWSFLPVLPALAAVLLIYLLPPFVPGEAGATPDQQRAQAAVKQTMEKLDQQLEQRRKEAQEQGLKDLDKLLEQLQDGTRETLNKKTADPSQAVVKLNDLAQEFEKRREELGSADKMREQLSQLKGANEGPADKLARALKNGDLKQAAQELQDLQKQMKNGELDEKKMEQLANQLNEMKEKLDQVAKDHQQKQQALQDQIDKAKQAGNQQQANQLQQQLDQHNQQAGQMKQLQQLADKLGQCKECLNQGNMADAIAGLQGIEQDLQGMQQQLNEMQMLDGALDQLAQAKGDMLCQGQCDQPGGEGQSQGKGQSDRWKNGPGGGRGIGRGDGGAMVGQDKDGQKFIDSAVAGKNQGGAGVIVGEAGGPNRRGQIREQIKTELAPAQAERSDPIDNQQYPKPYREHTQQYLDALREGRTGS